MNMNELVQTFKNVVEIFNLVEGQNRGLKYITIYLVVLLALSSTI